LTLKSYLLEDFEQSHDNPIRLMRRERRMATIVEVGNGEAMPVDRIGPAAWARVCVNEAIAADGDGHDEL
jgi:hypothetical protein